jgi:hexosaminidase
MMKNLLIALCLLIASQSMAQNTNSTIAIIPEPVSVVNKTGVYTLPQVISITAPAQAELKQVVGFLKERIIQSTGRLVLLSSSPTASIRIVLNDIVDSALGNEGYRLTVTNQQVLLKANKAAGLFYAMQSLLQLLPKEIESAVVVKNVNWVVPCVEIMDKPRFGWRGLMFDVARHFFTKAEVKKFIDDMVRYKFNLLHLHLTDDEGWRIEIKGFPRLTEIGAWNVKKEGYFGTFSPPTPNEPKTYGGFYTQEDIKELVQYAKERFVNILPEIDVPGHSLAAVVSYPVLSGTPEAETYRVRSGEVIMDWSHGAPPIALVDNTLSPASEKTYDFLDKIVAQVAKLFPFEYIHMGGDECPKNYWEKNDSIKALMKKQGLKNMEEVQSYFEKRLEKIVASKGKKLIGWDEILEGGLAPGAAVMSWRGMKGGIEAAKQKHEVVMSPTTYAYLDYMQGDIATEPKVYATLRLKKTYEFEPVPEGVDPSLIKGGQANLWTEQIYNYRYLQYMLWPRAFAIAEAVWSPKEKRKWNPFFARVEKQFERFDIAEKKYSPAVYDPIIIPTITADKQLSIRLEKEVDGLEIYYSFDNTFPDNFYPPYRSAITPPKDAVMLRVVTYRGKKQVGRMMTISIADLLTRANKKEQVWY